MNAPVSVLLGFDHRARVVTIHKLLYDGTVYKIKSIGLHNKERDGRTLLHVYCVAGESCFFKLVLNTDTLAWTLQEMRNYAYDLVD